VDLDFDLEFGTYESCVAADEVIHGLSQAQLAYWWKHTKGITRQKDDILRVWSNTW